MATDRYRHLRPRVKADGMAYHSSIASRSKRDEKVNKEAEEMFKKRAEWDNIVKLNETNKSKVS